MLFHHRSGSSLKGFASPMRKKICCWRESFCACSGDFNENEVPVVAFKGPILAEAVYGDLSLREFCDLDLLIRVQDLTKAEDILLACGYTAQFPDRDYRTAFLSYHGQYAFRRGQSDLWVDLHWQFSPDGVVFPLRAAEVWPRLIEETVAGRTVPSLAHDDQALFLAAHGTKEGWRRLLWLCDFAEFLRRYQDLDWIAILERAARSHSSRQLLLAIELAATMLDAPAPAELLEKARNSSAVQSLARRARERHASDGSQRKLGISFRAQHPRQVSAQAVAHQGVSDDTNRRRSPGNATTKIALGSILSHPPLSPCGPRRKDGVRRCSRTSSMIMVRMNSKSWRLSPGSRWGSVVGWNQIHSSRISEASRRRWIVTHEPCNCRRCNNLTAIRRNRL